MSVIKTMSAIAAFALLGGVAQARELNASDAAKSAELAKFAVTNVQQILGCQAANTAYAISSGSQGKRVMVACGDVVSQSGMGAAVDCASGKVTGLNNVRVPAPTATSRRAVRELCAM